MELPDHASKQDHRGVTINNVGVCGVKYPITIPMRDKTAQQTIADIRMSVELDKADKGTHMSRFVEVLEEVYNCNDKVFSPLSSNLLIERIRDRLDARVAYITLEFEIFLKVLSPATAKRHLKPYGIRFEKNFNSQGRACDALTVEVIGTACCPCSKEISEYGAHNQKSIITLTVCPRIGEFVWFEDLIEKAESCFSSRTFPLLKRLDEKSVTESMYDNPKFVEDIIRDVYSRLDTSKYVAIEIRVENQESIHPHNAFAQIKKVFI